MKQLSFGEVRKFHMEWVQVISVYHATILTWSCVF